MHDHPQDVADVEREDGRSTTATLIILVVIAAAAITFIAQNSDKATIQFLFIEVTTRIWVGFLITLALGVVLDRLFAMWWKRRKQQQR
jgi:hypothetical protein